MPPIPLPTREHSGSGVYLLPSVSDNENEVTRAFREYFEGELCALDLKNERPQRILELGCGSGAWAIQAAIEFPEAQVVAVDISPLPAHQLQDVDISSVLPDNMTFQLVDLRANLPFERESFDIVHSRMVMVHVSARYTNFWAAGKPNAIYKVPNAKDLIHKAALLVKPGGLLLLDDMDHKSTVDTGGPAVRRCMDKIQKLWEMSGLDAEIGRKFQSILAETGWFSDIQVDKIAVPLGGCAHDERLNKLGLRSKEFSKRFVLAAGARLAGEGLTEEMVQDFVEELDQGSSAVWHFYFCAARRGILAKLDAQDLSPKPEGLDEMEARWSIQNSAL
ncbi:S-adenosyl-L-methionine-dependent methyltransferase [Roridomyces roridus]|uniref:S-adenosyl-L-methionine-dependent methyltransferase n=1 Tax=Roridomyces roridus TaxID=1738132 RepID=A0AAD7BXL4_9AGAR|nr:S-adenosyl-L-methionine-dependent methyltransferase [Roridomyces roridus]